MRVYVKRRGRSVLKAEGENPRVRINMVARAQDDSTDILELSEPDLMAARGRSKLLEDLVEPLYETEPLMNQVDLNDIGQLEPIEELYPLEPMNEPYELDLIRDIEPLAEEGVEVL